MEIGEFSKKTNISIDTLRYYNKIGLLVPKRAKSIRQYDDNDVEKADVIKRLKYLDFSLDEIKMICLLDEKIDVKKITDEDTRKTIKEMSDLIERKSAELEKKEQEIIKVKAAIEKMRGKIKKVLNNEKIF